MEANLDSMDSISMESIVLTDSRCGFISKLTLFLQKLTNATFIP